MGNQTDDSDEWLSRRIGWYLVLAVFTFVATCLWGLQDLRRRQMEALQPPAKHISAFHPTGPLPPPPQWLKEDLPLPEWWDEIVVTNYPEAASYRGKYARQKWMERIISKKVLQGIPPVQERRQLIKYMSLWANSPKTSPSDRSGLMSDMAATYEKLGDYKMAARIYRDEVERTGGESGLYSLAFQYERAGDNEAALQIYNFMIESFRNGSLDRKFGKLGKSRLGVVTSGCVLRKPEWWSQYEGKPDWWTNETVELPKFTCFQDGLTFIGHQSLTNFPRKRVKALTQLAESQGLYPVERLMSASAVAMAYGSAGDHHRAIESEWKIPERFSVDPFDNTNRLEFIAREFEALGETNHAREIRDAIPCFSKWPEGIER
jgi:tetratricopeptide (TPR) repeat protein